MTDKQRNEYVEKKAKELIDKIEDIYPAFRSTTYWGNFILSIIKDCQSKVSKRLVGKVTARIYCDRRSSKAVKAHVREGFEEAGFEVEK